MDVGANSHSVTDHTQGNWNGIVGKIELQSRQLVYFDDIQIFPDIINRKAKLKVCIINNDLKTKNVKLEFSANGFNSKLEHNTGVLQKTIKIKPGKNLIDFELDMGKNVQLWDEFHPALYYLNAGLKYKGCADSKRLQFGMREVSIEGKYIYINGRKTLFLSYLCQPLGYHVK